jgi:hypothetical protein
MDRLQRLIFSYYREEPALQQLLQPLHSCRMRRSWGSVRIECRDDGHLEDVSALSGLCTGATGGSRPWAPDRVAWLGFTPAFLSNACPLSQRSTCLMKTWRSTIKVIDRMQLACDFGRG